MLPGGPCLRSFIVGFLAVPALVLMTGCDSQANNGQRITSYANLYKIGLAIRSYADEKGARPPQLSNLVPQYVHLDQIGIFYVTNNYARKPDLPPDWASNPSRIDQYSSYVYLSTNNEHGVLAYEKTDLWKPNAPNPGESAVLFTDFHVQSLPILKLLEMLGAKAPSEAKRP